MFIHQLVAHRRVAVTKHAKRCGFDVIYRSEERDLCDDEGASPNPARGKLDSASLHEILTANLPEITKPATDREEMNISACLVTRGDWRERVSKEYPGYPGYSSRSSTFVVKEEQRLRGSRSGS